jgi:WD40 repeat protein
VTQTIPDAHADYVKALAFFDTNLVSGAADGELKVWHMGDNSEYREAHVFPLHHRAIEAILPYPTLFPAPGLGSGTAPESLGLFKVLTVSSDVGCKIYDFVKGEEVYSFTGGHATSIYDAAFDHNGSLLTGQLPSWRAGRMDILSGMLDFIPWSRFC